MSEDLRADARVFVDALREYAQPAAEVIETAEDLIGPYDNDVSGARPAAPKRHPYCGRTGCVDCARIEDALENPCDCGECPDCDRRKLNRRRKP